MTTIQTCSIIDGDGQEVAQIGITDFDEGWYYGVTVSQSFPMDLQKALQWYDEVVSSQMLSYLDEADDAVERFRLRVRLLGGETENVHSLQLSKNGEVTFRTSPVPPLPEANGCFQR